MVTKKNDTEINPNKEYKLVDLEEKEVAALKKIGSGMGLEVREVEVTS